MILGLHGRMGAGKNTVAERLGLLSSLPVVEVSFAAKLKQSAAALLGCTVADLEEWKNNPDVEVGVWWADMPADCWQTVRSFLQRYGTEAHRDVFGEDFWIDQVLPLPPDTMLTLYDDALYVVTDVRFPNEAARVRELFGTVVGVVGPNEDTGDHPSEKPLVCDYTLDNRARGDGFASLDFRLRCLLDELTLSIAA